MKIVLKIDGGIGKSIAATAVCKAIKKQYPDGELIVITGYPEVFIQNPHVEITLSHNELNYFYKQHILGQKDTLLLLQEPYLANDFIHVNGHLISVWCAMNGIAYNNELPELYLTHQEKTAAAPLFQSNKPILAIQTNGGVSANADKYSWPRDLPIATAQRVVNAFVQDYNIVHIRRQDQLPLQNTYPVQTNFRALAVLISMSHKRLFIDSFAQHAAAALGKPSVVCWIANTPLQFGYEMHNNIIANPPTQKLDLRNAIFGKFNIAGSPPEFPYRDEAEIFNADMLIAALRGEVNANSEVKKKVTALV